MEKSSAKTGRSNISKGSNRRGVQSTSKPKKKRPSTGSWKGPLDEFVKNSSVSSNTTCLTSEMSVSPSDENGRPKLQVMSASVSGTKANSRAKRAPVSTPPVNKQPARIIDDAVEISDDESSSSDGSDDSSEYEASVEDEMSWEPTVREHSNEGDASTTSSSDSDSDMSEDDSSSSSHASGISGSSTGQQYSKSFEESEGSSHAYLSAIGIGNPEKMDSFRDTKHRNVKAHRPNKPPSKPSSQNSELFNASYGSMSLGGDTSLSSMDSFQNSPKALAKPIVHYRVKEPNPAAPPPKPILREKESPKPTRRRYYSSDEDSEPDSDSDVSALSSSDAPQSQASLLSAVSNSSDASSSFLPSSRSSASSAFVQNRGTRLSATSGDVSIPTISDSSGFQTDENVGGSDDGKLPSLPPFHSSRSSMQQSKSSQQKNSTRDSLESHSSSFTKESWSAPVQSDSFSMNLSNADASGTRSNESAANLASHGSWTIDWDWAAPKEASDHWASSGPAADTWPKEAESEKKKKKKSARPVKRESTDTRGSRTSKSSKGSRKSLASKSSQGSKKKKKKSSKKSSKKSLEPVDRPRAVPTPAKPRSADDKNAPWYCGDDDDDDDGDSLNSDSSSVLSAFKKNKKSPIRNPVQDKSMSFSDLLGSGGKMPSKIAASDRSMSLGDLNGNGDKSMSFGDLNKSTEMSMQFGDLNAGGLTSKRSMPMDMLQEEPLESFSLSDLQSINNSEGDEQEAKGKSNKLDKSLSIGLQAPSLPQSDRSNKEQDSSSEDAEGANPMDTSADPKDNSMRLLWWIFIVGFVLFLIFDLILLTIFLTQRDKDNTEPTGGVLASVPETLCWDWIPGQGKSLLCNPSETASGGAVGNLVAQAIRSQSPQPVDISLIPAGLTIGDISKGDFSSSDAEKVVRSFNSPGRRLRGRNLDVSDSLMIIEGTGERIMQVLEMSLADSLSNGQPHFYPYAAGLRYSVASEAPQGQRVIAPVALKDEILGALDQDEVYSVITTSDWANSYFRLQGTSVSMSPLTALTGYAQNKKTLLVPDYSTREYVAEIENPAQEPEVPDGGGPEGPVVEENICLEWVPGQGLSNFCSREETAARGGGVGNLVAWGLLTQLETYGESPEMFLLKASDCQIDLEEGALEDHDVTALIPVNEEIVFLTLSGYQLVDVLEEGLEHVIGTTSNSGSYPYAGGLRFKIDATAEFGSRFSEIEWFSRGRWKAITLTANYKVATTFTLAEGGAGYVTLFDALARIDTTFLIRNVFMDYAIDVGTLRTPPASQFSTQMYTTA